MTVAQQDDRKTTKVFFDSDLNKTAFSTRGYQLLPIQLRTYAFFDIDHCIILHYIA